MRYCVRIPTEFSAGNAGHRREVVGSEESECRHQLPTNRVPDGNGEATNGRALAHRRSLDRARPGDRILSC